MVNKAPPKTLKKSKTVVKKTKTAKKKTPRTKPRKQATYTNWKNSLRSHVKLKSMRPKKTKKNPKSATARKAKTVKKKMKSRKTKSTKLNKKKSKKKRKPKKKTKPKQTSSFISDLSMDKSLTLNKKIGDLQIENQQLKKAEFDAVKSFNFVYQVRRDAENQFQPQPNPFQLAIKLPRNSGEQSSQKRFDPKMGRLVKSGKRGR